MRLILQYIFLSQVLFGNLVAEENTSVKNVIASLLSEHLSFTIDGRYDDPVTTLILTVRTNGRPIVLQAAHAFTPVLRRKDSLYLVDYSPISSKSELICYSYSTGDEKWRHLFDFVKKKMYSQYSNSVSLSLNKVGDLMIEGREDFVSYICTLSPDGVILSSDVKEIK